MQFLTFEANGTVGLAVGGPGNGWAGLTKGHASYPGALFDLIGAGTSALTAAAEKLSRHGAPIDLSQVKVRQPFDARGKIICVGLNYADHAAESRMETPDYPTLFARFATGLIAHNEPLIRPSNSDKLDFEGEVVAVIGKRGRRIAKADAVTHISGYSIFNDGSIRDYQRRTTQWTVGKNFDGTGAFGPVFVTADELPPGASGLQLTTRLNGLVMQKASTDDLMFDVATLVSLISDAMTLQPGDMIVTGTPSGVGAARNPPVFMKAGDVCEVEVERIGILRNRVVDEA